MKWVPLGLISVLAILAFAGVHVRAYEMSDKVRCAYGLAEQASPPADAVVIGASRVRRGIDTFYVEELLSEKAIDARVDRLSLNLPIFQQYYPLLKRYINERGAPRIAYLQLVYNFKSNRQKTWNLPLNPLQNVAFGRLSDLAEIQLGAPLNETGNWLPTRFHAQWQSLPAAWLNKAEVSIYSALRYFPRRVAGKFPACTEAFQRTDSIGLTLESASSVAFEPLEKETLLAWRTEAASFLPLAPGAPWRRGETAQLRKLIRLLEDAGTHVVFLIMPSLEQREIDPNTMADIGSAFPGIEVFFPMNAYDGDLAQQISVSFSDTHHANLFGAVYFSRALADDLGQRIASGD